MTDFSLIITKLQDYLYESLSFDKKLMKKDAISFFYFSPQYMAVMILTKKNYPKTKQRSLTLWKLIIYKDVSKNIIIKITFM